MEKDKFSYQIIEGQPSPAVLQEILVAYQSIFDDYKLDFFKQRIHEKQEVITVLCYDNDKLIAFKIGYRYNETTFYSWVGGVLDAYRQQGVAKKLAELQEEKVIEKGYVKLRTKSMNRFKPMMILNLKNGFDIAKVYTNEIGQTKVIFEKPLK